MFLIIIQAVIQASIGVIVIASIGAYVMYKKYINSQFTTQLSSLVERVFLPSLIFTNFLQAITLEEIIEWVPVILTTILCLLVGWFVGWLSNKYWITDQSLKPIIILATANPHTTNIQLQLASGLGYLFSENGAENRLITTIMIQTVIVNSLRWSLGKAILLQYSDHIQQVKDVEMQQIQELQKPIISESNQQVKKRTCWNMPLFAVCAALVTLMIPQLQQYMLQESPIHYALFKPLYNLGRASPPSVLLILGSNLQNIYSNGTKSFVDKKQILLITSNRFIIMPICGLIIVNCLSFIIKDQCQQFILFITFCTPCAMNILVMSKQYASNTEDVVSLLLLFSCLLSIITLPIWMIIYFSMSLAN